MSSSEYVSITCPSCGGAIAFASNKEHFKCGHCDHEYRVRHDNGIVSFTPVVEPAQNGQDNPDHIASKLEIDQLKRELINLRVRLHDARLSSDANFVPRSYVDSSVLIIMIGSLLALLFFTFTSRHGLRDLFQITLGLALIVNTGMESSRSKSGRPKRDHEMDVLITKITVKQHELDRMLESINR